MAKTIKEVFWEDFWNEFSYDCDGSGCEHSTIPHKGRGGQDDWDFQEKLVGFLEKELDKIIKIKNETSKKPAKI